MTDYQRSFIETIRLLTKFRGGLPPTCREIAEARDIAVPTAVTLVRRLVRYGYLTQEKGRERTIRPVPAVIPNGAVRNHGGTARKNISKAR